jgi:hypothetical protein
MCTKLSRVEIAVLLDYALDFEDDEALDICVASMLFSQQIASERALSVSPRLDVLSLPDDVALHYFKFTVPEVTRVCALMRLPSTLTVGEGRSSTELSTVEATCVLLARLRSPRSLESLGRDFGRSATWMSRTVSSTLALYALRTAQVLHWDSHRLDAGLFSAFSSAFSAAGSPRGNIFALLDGTRVAICRPKRHQRSAYSGFIRRHCLLFHALVSPDGVAIHFHGPLSGRNHDASCLRESGLLSMLQTYPQFAIFADGGYARTPQVITPVRLPTTQQDTAWNKSLSMCRVAVEWFFGRVKSLFALFNMKISLKVLQTHVGDLFRIAVFFTNLRTCIDEGNVIACHFLVAPPSLEEYLHAFQ